MNIWFDILHTPQYNFYRNIIRRLDKEGHRVYVTVLNRGKMPAIVRHELADCQHVQIDIIGEHRFTKLSAIWHANVIRLFQLMKWKCHKKIDVAFSNGFLCPCVCWLNGVPAYAFDDDPQCYDYRPKIWFSKKSYYCLYKRPQNMTLSRKVEVLPVLKEWSYLALNQFVPNKKELEAYHVEPYSYFFFREVSVGTVNYVGQAPDSILRIAQDVPKDMPVLLSLEKKDKYEQYPKNWTLLQEPLEDIHSLIYYSCGLVSSGDSMAREAALLGVPSYYLGVRYDMPANAAAAKVAKLQNQQTMDIKEWLKRTADNRGDMENYQQRLRAQIDKDFMDINQFIYDLAMKHQ